MASISLRWVFGLLNHNVGRRLSIYSDKHSCNITGNPTPYSICIFCSLQVVNSPCGQKEETNGSVAGVIELVNQALSFGG